jgi:hypothetical protein
MNATNMCICLKKRHNPVVPRIIALTVNEFLPDTMAYDISAQHPQLNQHARPFGFGGDFQSCL